MDPKIALFSLKLFVKILKVTMEDSDSTINFTHQSLKSLSSKAESGELNFNGSKRITYRDKKTKNLGVRVSKTGRVSFFMRYRFNGERRRKTLGTFPDVKLRQARDEARKINYKISMGEDPKANRNDQQHSTFQSLVEEFWKTHAKSKLADSTREKYRRVINNKLLPKFGDMKPEDITKSDVRELMAEVVEKARERKESNVEESKQGHCRANTTKNVLSSIYSHTDIEVDNPCRDVKKLERSGPRRNPLNKEKVKTLWNTLESEHIVTQSLYRMLLILGQRAGETKRMRWDQIQDQIWTIPREETKSDRIHKIPLPSLAQNILGNLEPETGHSPWVFKSPSAMNNQHIRSFSRSVNRIREKAGFTKDDFRIHDLRSTVRTFLSKLGVQREIADRIQNHSIKSVADDHYDAYAYIPEKREALQKWDNKLREIVGLEQNNSTTREEVSSGDDLQESLDKLSSALFKLDLNGDNKQILRSNIQSIEAQLSSPDPNETIIQEGMRQLRKVIHNKIPKKKTEKLLKQVPSIK